MHIGRNNSTANWRRLGYYAIIAVLLEGCARPTPSSVWKSELPGIISNLATATMLVHAYKEGAAPRPYTFGTLTRLHDDMVASEKLLRAYSFSQDEKTALANLHGSSETIHALSTAIKAEEESSTTTALVQLNKSSKYFRHLENARQSGS